MSIWLRFVLAVLATWRVTHLLASEDGPVDLIVHLRSALGESWGGKLLDCFYCLSVWIAAPAALFVTRNPVEWIFSWLALSGGACLLEGTTREAVVIEPMAEMAEGDINDVLRPKTNDAEHAHAGADPFKSGPAWNSTPGCALAEGRYHESESSGDAGSLGSCGRDKLVAR